LTGKRRRGWQETEYVLRWFSEQRGKAIRRYRKFVEEGKGQGRRTDLVGGGLIRSLGGWSRVVSLRDSGEEVAHDARILGGGGFVEEVLKEADRNLRRQLRLKERSKQIDRVITAMCESGGVSEEELRNGGQRRRVSELRAKVCYQLSRDFGIPMAEIARHVGVSASAVVKSVQKRESEN
jgi:hypothetical protein